MSKTTGMDYESKPRDYYENEREEMLEFLPARVEYRLLHPKEAAVAKSEGRVCDCCKKPIRGRKNVFKRLEYQYCSTKCVNDHKRELMASAALARFGG